MNRSQVRELAFKLLYQIEIQKEITKEDIELFLESNDINSKQAQEYIEDVVYGIEKASKEILSMISNNLKQDWEVERVSKVNLALLKLGIYEIKYKDLGKTVKEALLVTNKAVMEALDGLPPVKVHCSCLAEEALHAALWDYAQKNNIVIDGLKPPVDDVDELHHHE